MFDADNNGEITEGEFVAKIKELAKEHNYAPTKSELNKAVEKFQEADIDNSGSVSKEELEKSLKKK